MDHLGAVIAVYAAISGLLGSVVNLDSPGHYLNWGFIHISVANLVVICLMVVTFILAIFLPFPGHRSSKGGKDD